MRFKWPPNFDTDLFGLVWPFKAQSPTVGALLQEIACSLKNVFFEPSCRIPVGRIDESKRGFSTTYQGNTD